MKCSNNALKLAVYLFITGLFLHSHRLSAQPVQKSGDTEAILDSASQMPVFRDGSFDTFARRNMDYPPDALERKIEGRVLVSFVVNKAGKVLDARVLRGIGYGCDEEAIDLVNETSGKWNPATHGGQKVSVRMVLPVVFRLGMP